MELRQLRDFVAVVKAGSLAGASRILNVSQPGLGYQIKQLELDLGTALLVRHSRGIELTPAGAIFMADAERVLAIIAEAKAKVRDAVRAEMAEIKIGLSPTPQQLLAPALSGLSIGGHAAVLSFREGLSARLIQEVRSGTLDVAICISAEAVPDLRTVPLYREYLHLVGPVEDGAGRDVSFDALGRYRLIAGPRDHLPRRVIDEAAARRRIMLDIAQELEPGGLRSSLVRHGSIHTIASAAMFLDEIEAGALSARRIVDPTLALEVQMICAPGLSPAVETALTDCVAATVAAHPTIVQPVTVTA